jgi:hypothetical protein
MGAWWPVGVSGIATFYNVLANARLFQLKELTGTFVQKSDSLSLSMQNNAIRAMTERMKDPEHYASDEVVGGVASFMCHFVSCSTSVLSNTDCGTVCARQFCRVGSPSQCNGPNDRDERWREQHYPRVTSNHYFMVQYKRTLNIALANNIAQDRSCGILFSGHSFYRLSS